MSSKDSKIYNIYEPTNDITFIMEARLNDDGKTGLLTVKGFYFGEPNDLDNKVFYNDLEAVIDLTDYNE